MPKIGIPIDDVQGQIIGGEYGMAWVSYEDRQQGDTVYPTTKEEADLMLDSIVAKIKKECGDVFKDIYPLQQWKYHYSGI